ncbi:MAG: hypothetical protein AMXMBFR61_10220 [Fimbriimonadales bacterium]
MVKSSAVPTDPVTVANMRLLLQQMSEMQEDIEGILGWVEGQNEALLPRARNSARSSGLLAT